MGVNNNASSTMEFFYAILVVAFLVYAYYAWICPIRAGMMESDMNDLKLKMDYMGCSSFEASVNPDLNTRCREISAEHNVIVAKHNNLWCVSNGTG